MSRMVKRFWAIFFIVTVALVGISIFAQGANSHVTYIPLVQVRKYTPTNTPSPTPTFTPSPTDFPHSPPPFSTSYYMRTIDSTTMGKMGCDLGTLHQNTSGGQDVIVVLAYGMPREWDGNYGASLFGFGPVTTLQIAEAIKEYGEFYVSCSQEDPDSHLTIGIGTSNYFPQESANLVTYEHGRAWAQMVNNVNAWFIAKGFYQRVSAVGANDMELGWNSPAITRNWVDGYDSANLYALVSFSDAEGCPTIKAPHWNCGSDKYPEWESEDVWYINYGSGASYPLPLIYATSGVNARQWAWLSLYGYLKHGARMDFWGSFTQYQSCQQNNDCDQVDNTPAQGWQFLFDTLNSDARTAQQLRWSTDIKWK